MDGEYVSIDTETATRGELLEHKAALLLNLAQLKNSLERATRNSKGWMTSATCAKRILSAGAQAIDCELSKRKDKQKNRFIALVHELYLDIALEINAIIGKEFD
jgi:hypothetical protein